MSAHNVTTLRTAFQVQNELVEAAHEKIKQAYARGRAHGEQAAVNGALFLGFVFGVAISATIVIVAAIVIGWAP